jgi:CubicO group peptidase (beta-lactamase class C family)
LKPAEVDRIVEGLMQKAHVTGLALAILNRSEIVYLKAFGLRSVERNEPLTVNSVMYGASLTKAAFAYMVMQLVDEKVIDLDKPVTQYLSKPLPEFPKFADLRADDRYKQITARMLLSHTAGFPNYRFLNDDGKLDIKFAPGTRYAYSGEGINLLGFVVEQITGRSVGVLMRERVFDRFGMKRTSLRWEPHFASDYADGYDAQGKLIEHLRKQNPRAAGSMDTTLTDYAQFLRGLLRGEGLSAASREQMLSPQIRIHSSKQFPTLTPATTTENDGIRLSYGLGWGLFWSPFGRAYFKEGHDEGTENHAVCFDERKTCLLVLTNSSNGHGLFKDLLEAVLAERFTPWNWEDYIPFSR